jgi:hypothetical protein
MKDLKEKLKNEFKEINIKLVLNEDGGYEDDFYLNINNKIDISEGAYQKWDTYIEEEDKEVSFLNDEDLIKYIKDNIN